MKWNDLAAIFGVAAVTMTLSLVLFGPATVDAVDEPAEKTALVLQPKFEADGCEFTVATEQAMYGKGEQPVLIVTAKNTTNAPVDARIWLTLQAQSPSSPMSRIPSIPQSLWSQECPIPLAAAETRSLRVETGTVLPEGMSVSVLMGGQKSSLIASRLFNPVNNANPVPNAPVALAVQGSSLEDNEDQR